MLCWATTKNSVSALGKSMSARAGPDAQNSSRSFLPCGLVAACLSQSQQWGSLCAAEDPSLWHTAADQPFLPARPSVQLSAAKHICKSGDVCPRAGSAWLLEQNAFCVRVNKHQRAIVLAPGDVGAETEMFISPVTALFQSARLPSSRYNNHSSRARSLV